MSGDFDKADVPGVETVEGAMLTYFEYNCMRFAKQVAKLNEAIQQAAAKGELEVTVLLADFGGFEGKSGNLQDAGWLMEQEFRKFLRNYLPWLGYATVWSSLTPAWKNRERGRYVGGRHQPPAHWDGTTRMKGNHARGFTFPTNNWLETIDCRLFETTEENTIHQIWQLQTLKIGWGTTDFSEPQRGDKNSAIRKVYVMNQPRPTQWQMRE